MHLKNSLSSDRSPDPNNDCDDCDDILKLKRKPDLYLKLTTPKGRGVFTSTPIKKGEVVEVSPVLIFTHDDGRGGEGKDNLERLMGGVLGSYT